MSKFGVKFHSEQIEIWKERYIDYNSLKNFIKEQCGMKVNPQPDIENQPVKMNKSELIKSFVTQLDKELKKVYLFFVQTERELYIKINSRLHIKQEYYTFDDGRIENEFNELIEIAQFTTNLTKYIHDNIFAMEKLLEKFDKKFRNYNTNLANSYIIAKLEMKNSDLLYIFQFKIIDEVSTLLEEISEELLDFYKRKNNNGKGDLNQNLLNNQGVSLDSITNKANQIKAVIDNIEGYYKSLQKQYRAWTRILKLKEYAASNPGLTTSDQIEINTSISSSAGVGGKVISDANKWNVYLTLLQKMYMAACSTLILSNNYSTMMLDFNKKEYYSCLIIAMTPLGGLISMLFTKYIIIKSYKIPMIISAILAVIGNAIYTVGIAGNSIPLHCISRLLIGFALNTRVHRKYLLEFIPKRKISNYLLSFKLCYLVGNALGPIITLIFGFFGGDIPAVSSRQLFVFNAFTNPSWFCTGVAIVMLLLICIFYAEPVSTHFNAYAEGQAPSEAASRAGSFSIEGVFTNKESDSLQKINDKLSEFNEENKYSDTNLVTSTIDNIMIKERGPGSTIAKAYIVVIMNVFFSNIISMSLLVNTPMHLNDIYDETYNPKMSQLDKDNGIAMMIAIALFSFVAVYFFNFFYVSVKFEQTSYILFLDFVLICLEGLMIVVKGNISGYSLTFIFVVIFAYLLEDTNIYFFTKMIPSDYSSLGMSAPTGIQFFGYFGMIIGCCLGLIGFLFELSNIFNYIIIAQITLIVMITIFALLFKNQFRDKAIRRIFRNKNTRKMRRTEF